MSPTSFLFRKWHERAEKRALTLPRYKEIHDLRHDTPDGTIAFLDESKGLTWDVYEEEQQLFSSVNTFPRYLVVLQFLAGHNPRTLVQAHKRRHLRAKHGFAPGDVWNLDSYLANVIAKSIEQRRVHGHTWPGDPLTEEQWDGILSQIVKGFSSYTIINNAESTQSERDAAKLEFDEGFRLLHKHFEDLWD